LSKLIKIKSLSHEDKEEELAEYFPSFLWLLRDFSLKLENLEGKEITEKEYLETALENKSGNSDIINEKNEVRNLIKAYFPDRDCFTMVRPVEKEDELQNLQNLPDNMLRKEFLVQSQNFRNKVFNLVTPKTFHKRALNGSMLIELIQHILDSINNGAIPIIENTWKYVIQNECIKNTQNLADKFSEEINNFRDLNKNDKNFAKNVKNFTKNLYKKYINEFLNNDLIDEENKKEFVEKLKKNLNNQMDKFDKENESIFRDNFESSLNDLSNNFLKVLSKKSDNKNFNFFFEFDNFIQKAKQLSPDFPQKSDIIYEKVVEIRGF
jgi:F0F1-type ATP synthase delta subunit